MKRINLFYLFAVVYIVGPAFGESLSKAVKAKGDTGELKDDSQDLVAAACHHHHKAQEHHHHHHHHHGKQEAQHHHHVSIA